MKSILLSFIYLAISIIGVGQQYNIEDTNYAAGIRYDPVLNVDVLVSGEAWRNAGAMVRYNHLNAKFEVTGGWLTQFNEGIAPGVYGSPGNNTDYFLFQGNNEISGTNGTISFDTVRFNIGASNVMSITNFNSGFPDAPYYGQSPGGIMIAKALYFNNGITTTLRNNPVNGAIVFVNNAFYEGGSTDAQHVDGFVSEINYASNPQPRGHNGDFTFPVGNGSEVHQLRRQGIFNDADSTLTVGWVNEDPNLPATQDPTQKDHNPTINLPDQVVAIVKAGFWDWHYQRTVVLGTEDYEGATAMKNPQTITVSIPDLSDYPGLQPSELRLIGYDPLTLSWLNLSGSAGASGLTKGSTLQGTIPAEQLITAIAIGSTNNVILPVTFSAFTVKAEGCKALLEWQTGMEQNNSHFVIEHSINGNEFTAIGRVGAVGNSNSLNTYRFKDEAPVSGINYYRITQVDFDGKHSSTDIKAIRIQCNGNAVAIKAYPNPATSQVNIQSGKAVAQVNVVASNGQTVMKYVPSQNQGGTFSLNIQRVQKGIYLLQVVNKDGTIDVIKLLKQ